MKSRWFLLLAGLLVLSLAGWPPAFGAAPKKPGQGEVPLRITAAHLEADQNTRVITFSGQVKAQYGDATLYAQQLRVYFKAESKPAPGAANVSQENSATSPLEGLGGEKIDHIVAQGNVRLVQGDRVASGQEAIYYQDRNEVVLTGNPQLWRAENTLKGNRITLNLNTNRVIVESSPQRRVEALLYSKGSAEGKTSLPFGPTAPKGRQP